MPAELADWPACTLGEAQLGDLELLTSGAFAPLRGFMDAAEVTAVTEHGTLADGTPWPVPVTLDVPAGAVPADATRLVLQDPEGSPLAVLSITERARVPRSADSGLVRLAGPVTALREPEHGPFRQLRRRPEDVRAELAGPDGSAAGNVLAYATRRPLNKRHIGQLRHYAGQLNARLLLLPLVGGPAEIVTRPEALVRAVLAARQHLPAGTLVVPVPLAPRSEESGADGGRRTSTCVPRASSRRPTAPPTCWPTHPTSRARRPGRETARWRCPECRSRSSARVSGRTTLARRCGARWR